LEGRQAIRRIIVRAFADAATDFLNWAKAEHHEHPNSYKRLNTSFASLKEFFHKEVVSPRSTLDLPGASVGLSRAWREPKGSARRRCRESGISTG